MSQAFLMKSTSEQGAELVQFGASFGIGESIVQQLLKSFGPLLAQAVLKWLQSKLLANPNFAHEFASQHMGAPVTPGVKLEFGGDLIRKFVATIIRQHRDEVLGFVAAQLGNLFDQLIDLIDPPPAPPVGASA